MKTLIELKELWKPGTITIKTHDGGGTLNAYILDNLFAVHKTLFEEKESTLTHIPSGYALLTGLLHPKYGIAIASRLYCTLSDYQLITWRQLHSPKDLPKRHFNTVGTYLLAARKTENNAELEKAVGVFYRDLENTERLRMKINPEANTLLDDSALGSEKLTADLVFGKIVLAR